MLRQMLATKRFWKHFWIDRRVLKLPTPAKTILIGAITLSNNEDIFDPDPHVLRAKLAINASIERVEADVQRIIDLGLAIPCEVNGKPLARLSIKFI